MNLQPTLENDLLLLRPLETADEESLFDVAKDPLIWEQHPNNDRYKRNNFEDFFEDSIKSGGALIIIDKKTNIAIGSSRYKKLDGNGSAIEIGWSFLAREFWGGEYNRSFKTLMIEYAFKWVDEVVFYVGQNNYRSQRAVQKIGGIKIENSKFKHLMKQNNLELTFRIDKKDWKKGESL